LRVARLLLKALAKQLLRKQRRTIMRTRASTTIRNELTATAAAAATATALALLLGGIIGCSSDGGGNGGAGGAGTGGGVGGGPASTGGSGAGGAPDAGSDGTIADGGTGGGAGASADGGSDSGNGGDGGPVLPPFPSALPADPTNRFADIASAATLGQKLFFEKAVSGALAVASDGINGGLGAVGDTGKISCASCHIGPALDDRRSNPNNVSLGANFLTRNSLPLVNASFYTWTNWAGRFSAQWELPIGVVENARNMNGDRLRVAHVVFAKYRADYEAVVGAALPDALGTDTTRFPATGKPKAAGAADGPWETMTADDQLVVNTVLVNYGKLIEAYLRKLVSGGSRYDLYAMGDLGALTASEVRGLGIFSGKGNCASCHSGPLFTDNQFHNLGLPQVGPNVPATDNGRFTDGPALFASPFNSAGVFSDDRTTGRLADISATPPEDWRGAFRTPSLRNVATSGPYMHAGQIATLEAVVAFYNHVADTAAPVGVRDAKLLNLGLTTQEQADLVAFMGTLTSAPLPAALLVDTSAP
jgi:cytochrome c peroxidase